MRCKLVLDVFQSPASMRTFLANMIISKENP